MLLMQYIAWAWRTTKSKRRKRRGIGSPPMEGLERGSAINGNGNDEGLERGSAISGISTDLSSARPLASTATATTRGSASASERQCTNDKLGFISFDLAHRNFIVARDNGTTEE